MKLLGFLFSLLLHILFLLLLLHARFPMGDIPARLQVIEIVPLAPPAATAQLKPAPAPPLIYVRPFVLKGGVPGAPRGVAAGKGAPRLYASHAAGRGLVPGAGTGSEPAPATRKPETVAESTAAASGEQGKGRLTIDLRRIEHELTGKGSHGKAGVAGAVGDAAGGKGLPFGNSLGKGEGGDGTASTALAGNAFFDSRGYDITPWAQRMVYRVKKNWIMPPASIYGLKGTVGIYVVIGRDGGIARIFIRKASGIRPLDQAAFNAIRLSAPLAPLPDDFPYDDLPAYLLFYYK